MRSSPACVIGAFVALIQVAPSGSLIDRVKTLGRELRIEDQADVPAYDRAIAGGGAAELDKLLRDVTLQELRANPSVSAEELRGRLRSIYFPWNFDTDAKGRQPDVARVLLGERPVFVVSWLSFLGGGGAPKSHAQILAYTLGAQGWALAASTGDFLNDHVMFFAPVVSHHPGECWFLIYGTRSGSNRADMNVALVAFNGATFTTRWSYGDLAFGEMIGITQSGFQIGYRAYFASGPNFFEVLEDLAFTTEGAAVKSRSIRAPTPPDDQRINPPASIVPAPTVSSS